MAGTAIALISDPSGGSCSYRDFVCLEMAGTAITLISGLYRMWKFVRRSSNKLIHSFSFTGLAFFGEPGDDPILEYLRIFHKKRHPH